MNDGKRSSVLAAGLGVAAVGLALFGAAALASDYPQWRGVHRDGISTETGLLKQWPQGGPKLAWKSPGMGLGHGTVSVARGHIYGMGLRGQDEVVWALDEKTGKEVWSKKIADGVTLGGDQGGYGPRCTPTVDGAKLYVLGVGGELACLDVAKGNIIWQKSLTKEFAANVPQWGYSESPLIDGEKVIATPGGRNATLAAFNKETGAVIWTGKTPEGDHAGYSSAISADVDGKREYIQFLSGAVVGFSAADGKALWRYDSPANRVANCSTPVYRDHYVFAASSYGKGGGLAKLATTTDGVTATEVFYSKNMKSHHGGFVLVGDYLYGFDEGRLTCMEFLTGKVVWSDPSVGKGSVAFVDGMLVARSEDGLVGLVQATPTGYVEKGRFNQPDRSGAKAWPYPVVANGKLYLRDMDNLLCYDVRQTTAQR